jgi:hypothetical protein
VVPVAPETTARNANASPTTEGSRVGTSAVSAAARVVQAMQQKTIVKTSLKLRKVSLRVIGS